MRHSAMNLVASAAFCVVAGHAQATTVQFTGFANGSEPIHFSIASPNAVSGSASAGGFLTSIDGGSSITTYCVDLYQYISLPATYTDYQPATAHAFFNPNAYTGRLGNRL